MASYQQLQSEVAAWLNRQDILSLNVIPGWTAMLETELAQTLRARCMVTSAVQAIDAPYISLPDSFAAMASIRDNRTGEMLTLKDEWSGHWSDMYTRNLGANGYTGAYWQIIPDAPCCAYRIVANCIEFLPHPVIPDPPDPSWAPQEVLMDWYAKPRPLLLPNDTNAILEELYAVYFWGLCKYGALFAMDDGRAQQCDAQWQQAITRADLHKQQSDMSGAPFRAELACQF